MPKHQSSMKFHTNFNGKWVIVSGASSGIGRGIATALGQAGAHLLLIGRNLESLESTATASHAEEVELLTLDLQNLDQIAAEFTKIQKKIGKIYGFCAAAGTVATRPLSATKPSQFNAALSVNFLSAMELARCMSHRQVMEPEGGNIVFISSIYSQVGAPGQTAYCATKGALLSATKAMAVELAARNIRVNCLSPGFVKTPMTETKSRLNDKQLQAIIDKHPLGIGCIEDVARAALFLLDPENRWITGTNLILDGGYTAN